MINFGNLSERWTLRLVICLSAFALVGCDNAGNDGVQGFTDADPDECQTQTSSDMVNVTEVATLADARQKLIELKGLSSRKCDYQYVIRGDAIELHLLEGAGPGAAGTRNGNKDTFLAVSSPDPIIVVEN